MSGRHQTLKSLDSEFSLGYEEPEPSYDVQAELLAALSKSMGSAAEKRKAHERKFVAAFKGVTNQTTVEHQKMLGTALAQIDDTYNTFIQSYASLQDEIRKIWAQLADEEDKLALLIEERVGKLNENKSVILLVRESPVKTIRNCFTVLELNNFCGGVGIPRTLSTMMFSSFAKTLPRITIFHNPSSPQSVQALSLLKSALSTPYPPSATSSLPLQFDLDVVEKNPPTPDQLKIISSYLPAASLSRLSSSLQSNDSYSQPVSSSSPPLTWPIVVDWYAGKASIGDVDGVKDILESIRQKRDGEAKEETQTQSKGWL